MGCESSWGCAEKKFELRGNAQQVVLGSKILANKLID
jgi:hypothetical protein